MGSYERYKIVITKFIISKLSKGTCEGIRFYVKEVTMYTLPQTT